VRASERELSRLSFVRTQRHSGKIVSLVSPGTCEDGTVRVEKNTPVRPPQPGGVHGLMCIPVPQGVNKQQCCNRNDGEKGMRPRACKRGEREEREGGREREHGEET
jgi:hypothetical protein